MLLEFTTQFLLQHQDLWWEVSSVKQMWITLAQWNALTSFSQNDIGHCFAIVNCVPDDTLLSSTTTEDLACADLWSACWHEAFYTPHSLSQWSVAYTDFLENGQTFLYQSLILREITCGLSRSLVLAGVNSSLLRLPWVERIWFKIWHAAFFF